MSSPPSRRAAGEQHDGPVIQEVAGEAQEPAVDTCIERRGIGQHEVLVRESEQAQEACELAGEKILAHAHDREVEPLLPGERGALLAELREQPSRAAGAVKRSQDRDVAFARDMARGHIAVDGVVPDTGAGIAARTALRRSLLGPADLDQGIALDHGPDDRGDVGSEQSDVTFPEVAPQRKSGNCAVHCFEVQHVDRIGREESMGEKIAIAVLVRLADAKKARRTRGESLEPALDRPYRCRDTGADRVALALRQDEEDEG